MSTPGAPRTERDSRVMVFSQRHLASRVYRIPEFEFEDLLVEMDDVSLVSPPAQTSTRVTRTVNGLRRRTGARGRMPPSGKAMMEPTSVTTDHDLFVTVVHSPGQLLYLHRLKGWRERSRHAICVLVELWTPQIGAVMDSLELLREFDAVYVLNPALVCELQRRLGIPAPRYMHPAVDAFVFSPLPRTPRRVLDVYSYGRRSPVTHEALLRLVEQEGLTYLYDTPGPDYRDRREHRQLVANMMKRTRYFVAHDINDSPERLGVTGGEEALSTRYVEGAAGGAVLLGSRPHAPVFDDAFPSLDAVVTLPYDEPDVADVLADLDSQPERLARIRADNVRVTLERHDWAHRWRTILDDVGLQPLPGIAARLAGLAEMADSARPERFQP